MKILSYNGCMLAYIRIDKYSKWPQAAEVSKELRAIRSLPIHPPDASSGQNSFTCLYIHTSMHHIHICLSLVDTSIHFHPNELLRTTALKMHVSIQSCCFIPSHTVDTEHSTCLSISEMMGLSLCFFFVFSPQKDITDPGFLCLSTNPLSYHCRFLTFFHNAPLHLRWNKKAQTPSV